MKITDEYIEICRKLHEVNPRTWDEYQPGDWFIGEGIAILVTPNLIMKKSGLEGEGVWIPHTESQWMQTKNWNPDWILSTDEDEKLWHIGLIDRSNSCDECCEFPIEAVISDHINSLMACALAWKTVFWREEQLDKWHLNECCDNPKIVLIPPEFKNDIPYCLNCHKKAVHK